MASRIGTTNRRTNSPILHDQTMPQVPEVTEPVIQATPSMVKETMRTALLEMLEPNDHPNRRGCQDLNTSPLRPRNFLRDEDLFRERTKGKGKTPLEGQTSRAFRDRLPNFPQTIHDDELEDIADSEEGGQKFVPWKPTITKRASPFSRNILLAAFPRGFSMPDLPIYEGFDDPQEHVATFELITPMYGQTEAINCRLFVATLRDKAREWFFSLPNGTITSYDQLTRRFLYHFDHRKKGKKSATRLLHIKQGNDESLKEFIGRFNDERVGVQGLDVGILTSILENGLRKGTLASALTIEPPNDVEQLMEMCQKCIREEEMNALKDEEINGREHTTKNQGGRDIRRSEERGARSEKERHNPVPRPRYNKYTPLKTSRTNAMLAIASTDKLRWPERQRATPSKRNSGKYCAFHRDRGHDTEECYQLKDEIERLIQQGYLRHFIATRDIRGRRERSLEADGRYRRGRSRSRSKDREPYQHQRYEGRSRQHNEADRHDNRPDKGVINMIAGGPTGGDSVSARKKYARSPQSQQYVWSIKRSSQVITFDDRDLEGVDAPQDDPMVVTFDVAGFRVQKILIDNGSSVDIIFLSTLRRMKMDLSAIQQVRTPLVGFGGLEITPLGTIDLLTSMGKEPQRRTEVLRFLVVDCGFAYNGILGRPGLNAFRAIVSTYHLKVKFPTDRGVGELKCDQRSARECYNLSIKREDMVGAKSERGEGLAKNLEHQESEEILCLKM